MKEARKRKRAADHDDGKLKKITKYLWHTKHIKSTVYDRHHSSKERVSSSGTPEVCRA